MSRKFTKKQQQYIDYVYKTLSSLGYDRYSISGILGNALTESGLDADSVSKSKTYSGGWQNHKTVRQAIEDQYGDYSLKNQLKYIHDWNTRADHIIKGKYSPYTAMNAGKYKTSGYKTAKDAADAFMKLYERPVIMKNGKVVGYQGAADRYANADEIYNYLNTAYKPEGDIQVVTMPDGNKVMKISPRMYEKPQYEPEFKLYHDPKTIYPLDPAAREVPESLDAWNGADSPSKGPRMPSLIKQLEDVRRDDSLNGGFKPETTIYGRRRLSPLSLKLPSLDQMLDLGSPQQQLTEYFADALQVPKMHLDVLPAAKDGKDADTDYDSFLQTLPDNQRRPGVYNTRRYWELNGKPKNFAEAIGRGMYSFQGDGWHANSVAYNEQNDTFEFMKPNYHPTRWMEQVEGYDKNPEFQKDWKVQYNGPMLSDRYVRREKPGLQVKGGQLPKYGDGTDDGLVDAAVSLGKGFAALAPYAGTAIDAYDMYQDPSLTNLGYLVLSGIGDALYTTGAGAPLGLAFKWARNAAKARKTLSVLNNTRHVARRSQAAAQLKQARRGQTVLASESGNLVDTAHGIYDGLSQYFRNNKQNK